MKIALVGRYGEGDVIAGPERVARELYEQLKKRNEAVFIEYFFSGYKDTTFLKKIIGREMPAPDRRILRLGIIPLLITLVKEEFDIVHLINSQRFLLFVLLAKRIIKSRFPATLHGFLRHELNMHLRFRKRYFIDLLVEKLIVRRCDLLIFPSALLLDAFDKEYIIDRSRSKVIPNGIGKIFGDQVNLSRSIGDSFKFVFCSGFSTSIDRGLKKLISLLGKVSFNVELFVIGCEEFKINSAGSLKIFYEGFKNQIELIDFLRDKHFVIKAGGFESFGIFVGECMTLGLIPIINNNTGIKDFISHGINGFKYNIQEEGDLFNLLNDIYNGKFDLNLISRNAQKIWGELSWEKVSKQYIETYQKLL